MELSLYGSIAWRHPMGLAQVADWAAKYGWQSVDARGISLDIPQDDPRKVNAFGYDMLGPRHIRKSARKDLRKRIEDAGQRLLGIYCSSPLNIPGELGDRCRNLVLEYIRLAADLGAEWVRPINNFTDTVTGPPMSVEEAYERNVEGMKFIAPLANELGLGLLLENNENTTTHDAATINRMRSDLASSCRIGVAFDGTNAYFQGLDPLEQLAALEVVPEILHLKNVRRHQEQQWDYMPRGDASYEWVRLPDGDVSWPDMLRLAKDKGFDGPLVYEYVNPFKGMPPEYWDTLPEPEVAAEEEGKYLNGLIEELK